MADEGNGTQRDLGMLIGKLDGISQRLDRADASRANTHDRMDRMASDIAVMRSDLGRVIRDMDDMKPEVELIKGLRFKAAGAILVLGAIGALIGWAISSFGSSIVASIRNV